MITVDYLGYKYSRLSIIDDIKDFLTHFCDEQNNSLEWLKTIYIYDNIVEDYYVRNLKLAQVNYFEEKFNPGTCPSVHLYLYELFGCTINDLSKIGIIPKIKGPFDRLYYKYYGRYFIIHRLIVGLLMAQDDVFSLRKPKEDIIERANRIYDEYLNSRGVSISNKSYRMMSWWRILKSHFKTRKWENILTTMNAKRDEFIEKKRAELCAEEDSQSSLDMNSAAMGYASKDQPERR